MFKFLTVFTEADSVLPLFGSAAYHKGAWKKRRKRELAKLFEN